MVWNNEAPHGHMLHEELALRSDRAPRPAWLLRPRRTVACLIWSTLLSIPLWVATLAVAKVVLLPEVHALAQRWDRLETKAAPQGDLYARLILPNLLHPGQGQAQVMASQVMRRS